jgi:hypothetical protein
MPLVSCEVMEGPREGFKLVGVQSAEGHSEYLTIEEKFLVRTQGEYLLPVGVVGEDRRQRTMLIQLPYEADSGANRVWVRSDDVLDEKADEVPA